jgi:hypothetical protein
LLPCCVRRRDTQARRKGKKMDHIDSGDYTYDKLFHPQPVGEPWPDVAERKITALERESQEHTEEIANTDWNLKALLMRVESLERQVHRLLNPGAQEEVA